MLRRRAATSRAAPRLRCRCVHLGNAEPNVVATASAAAAEQPAAADDSSSSRRRIPVGSVTSWGVPPRHSIAAYMHDSRDHQFPPRWLGAKLPALAAVRKTALQPPPLPTSELLAAVAALSAERDAGEAAVVGARAALEEAWKVSDAFTAQGVDQADGGLLTAWWNKMKATSANHWHVADAGDDLLDAKEALAELDGKIWTQLHLTQLPPLQYEQLINGACFDSDCVFGMI